MTSAPAPQPPTDGPVPDSTPAHRLIQQLTVAQRRADEAEQAQRLAEEQAREATAARDVAQEELAQVLAERGAVGAAESNQSRAEVPAETSPEQPVETDRTDDDHDSARGGDGRADGGYFALFSDPLTSEPSLTGAGSDPGVLPVALGGTAVVALMVTLLALANGRLISPFGIVMVLVTAGLAYFAWHTRVERIEVKLSAGGVVYIERSGSGALRFDLRNDSTRVSMLGAPGTSDWSLTFARSGVDPFTVTTDMVDPPDFVARVRAFRPDL